MRPIMFTPENVARILRGEKTETRRVLKCETAYRVTSSRFTPEGKVEVTYNNGKNLTFNPPYGLPGDLLWVKANWTDDDGVSHSPLFMPKELSPCTIQLDDFRLSTLGDMTEADAIAEGCESLQQYQTLWDSINAKNGHPWRNYQKVWVVKFHLVERTTNND